MGRAPDEAAPRRRYSRGQNGTPGRVAWLAGSWPGRTEGEVTVEAIREYVVAVRLFSRNARLYMVHIVGMDMIHGTWEVLFNLYLLALFTPSHGVNLFGVYHLHAIEFVGARLAIG